MGHWLDTSLTCSEAPGPGDLEAGLEPDLSGAGVMRTSPPPPPPELLWFPKQLCSQETPCSPKEGSEGETLGALGGAKDTPRVIFFWVWRREMRKVASVPWKCYSGETEG